MQPLASTPAMLPAAPCRRPGFEYAYPFALFKQYVESIGGSI